jgi:hypothetical protein
MFINCFVELKAPHLPDRQKRGLVEKAIDAIGI